MLKRHAHELACERDPVNWYKPEEVAVPILCL